MQHRERKLYKSEWRLFIPGVRGLFICPLQVEITLGQGKNEQNNKTNNSQS